MCRDSKRGQAMVEFAIGLFAFALIIAALTELGPVFLRSLGLQGTLRAQAGDTMLRAESGTSIHGSGEARINAATRNGFPSPAGGEFPADPWLYPIAVRPQAQGLRNWQAGTVQAASGAEAFTTESFDLPFLRWLGEDGETEGTLNERVVMPPMGGL